MVYLIKSDSYNLLNEKLDSILKGLDEIRTFSLNDTPLTDIIEDLGYVSLFGEKRAIIVKDTKYFGGTALYEEDCKKLEKVIKDLPEDTILIFICNDIRKDKEITKFAIANNAEIINIGKLNAEKLKEVLKEYIDNHNITIKDSTLNKLIENTGGVYDPSKNPEGSKLDVIIKELEKLSLYDNGNITDETIELCSVKLENDVKFDFSNAVVAKDYNKAFNLLDSLINSGVEPIIILSTLASTFTTLYMVKDAVNHNLSNEDITELFGFSSKRTPVVIRNTKFYTIDDLGNIINKIYELDIKLKTGYNPVHTLKEFLINL